MPELTLKGIAIRYCHFPPVESGIVRCPDCGARLFDVVESLTGGLEKHCHRCKEADGSRRRWIFVFHPTLEAYTEAIKNSQEGVIEDPPVDI